MKVFLVHDNVDLGTNVVGVYLKESSAVAETDRLNAIWHATYGDNQNPTNYHYDEVDVIED